jgi:hypothetical protein
MDNWIATQCATILRTAVDPLVIDLGYGASPITSVELAGRLATVSADVRVLGLELDPDRVASAVPAARPPQLTFERGGFELAGHRPVVIRAANVLRQYSEPDARAAWDTMRARLAPGGVLVEGTCDEIGRLGGWVLVDESGPRSLTFACRVTELERPGVLAERLPKALIHHNVPGQPIHALLADLDAGWKAAAALSAFGPRQRWIAACSSLDGRWPIDRRRARFGELTVPWSAVAPG